MWPCLDIVSIALEPVSSLVWPCVVTCVALSSLGIVSIALKPVSSMACVF